MMWGAHWGGRLSDCPGLKYMPPCGSTLGCGTGDASGVFHGLSPLEVAWGPSNLSEFHLLVFLPVEGRPC